MDAGRLFIICLHMFEIERPIVQKNKKWSLSVLAVFAAIMSISNHAAEPREVLERIAVEDDASSQKSYGSVEEAVAVAERTDHEMAGPDVVNIGR
ncbi:hypothetical protein [Chitinimonas koreensis]|uniref:hypothetical protein n=1 Tax=Chitinimonas koreensis TaxID=356302 RepID=UPI0012FBCC53|nr:hypothetical protein [Chitinimonas koreensis]QNM97421.1 hypothetical protein H9L41_03680 [Chitinimonas koreensis]